MEKELMPLEQDVLTRERRGERGLPAEELVRLQVVNALVEALWRRQKSSRSPLT